jgi:hypothetical protein
MIERAAAAHRMTGQHDVEEAVEVDPETGEVLAASADPPEDDPADEDAAEPADDDPDAWAMEERVLQTLAELGAATIAEMATRLGLEDSRPVRGPVASLRSTGEIEVDPTANTDPKTYRLKEST